MAFVSESLSIVEVFVAYIWLSLRLIGGQKMLERFDSKSIPNSVCWTCSSGGLSVFSSILNNASVSSGSESEKSVFPYS